MLLVVLVVAAVLLGQFDGGTDQSAGPVGISIAVAISCTALGVLVLVAVPRHLVGRLLLAAGASAAVGTVAVSWTRWEPVAWLSQWTWWPAYGLLFLALLFFPDGRLPGRGSRALAVALVALTALSSIVLAVAALDAPRTLLSDAGVELDPHTKLLVRIFAAAVFLTVVAGFGVLGTLWARWRRADTDTRQQLACLLPAVVLLLLGWGLSFFNLDGGYILAAVAVPLGMTVAIMRYGLYDLDRVLNRTLVWLVMTALVVVGFVSIVTVLREVIMRNTSADSISLVTTGVIAITYAPLHRRVQQGVNQLLYGDRHDPYKVITELGDVLGQTAEPNAVLPLLTGTIANSLQVPYVAVEVEEAHGARLLAWYGKVGPNVQAFDMISRGEHIGRLLVSPRTVGGHFTPRETQLLTDIALHAGVAVEAGRLTRDLQESRERLVRAQEEERRRLRRDLHDGLGPSLTGMSMQVRAARKVSGPGRVRDILDALAGDLAACTAEVRQLVDELRPPALDRGLAVALRDECRRFDSNVLSVQLDLHDELDRLPAAVEVAAYRVVAEALNNVARHADARNCVVSVRRGRDLTIEITDDGKGITGPVRPGVGLASMRDRAGELGGEWEIRAAQPRGTTIRAHFPAASLVLVESAIPLPPTAADAPALASVVDAGPAPVVVRGAPVRLWPGGVVPYVVAPDVGPNGRISEAIAHLETNTSIRFVPRTGEHADYVRFVVGEEYASQVGRVGGEQRIEVQAEGEMGRVLHEMVHTLGRWHEHCRTDRDQYVSIQWQHISPESRPNFLIQATGPEEGPYDFESIMHYPRVAFSTNGDRTLETLQPVPPSPPGLPVGQRRRLSDGDCRVIERMYATATGVTATAGAAAGVPATVPPLAEADAVSGVLRLPLRVPAATAAAIRITVRDTTTTVNTLRQVGETVLTDVPLAACGEVPFRVPVEGVDPAAVYTLEAHVDVTGDGAVASGDLLTARACAVLTNGAPAADVAVPMTSVV
ncbi:M12 family metallopeptidase [Cryptosporangium sp. NPDC051539]|uniref:M12 family metallopeptidase n=1 Tax=Cryptosporangium sp. NPDC051539 TaxID=3363962 RepID=UPI0037AF7CCE